MLDWLRMVCHGSVRFIIRDGKPRECFENVVLEFVLVLCVDFVVCGWPGSPGSSERGRGSGGSWVFRLERMVANKI